MVGDECIAHSELYKPLIYSQSHLFSGLITQIEGLLWNLTQKVTRNILLYYRVFITQQTFLLVKYSVFKNHPNNLVLVSTFVLFVNSPIVAVNRGYRQCILTNYKNQVYKRKNPPFGWVCDPSINLTPTTTCIKAFYRLGHRFHSSSINFTNSIHNFSLH